MLFCVFLGFWSLNHVAGTITERYFKHARWLEVVLVLILTFLSSVGIYAGRFLRIHTIYLFISPDLIIHRLMGMWTEPMLEFVGLMMIDQGTTSRVQDVNAILHLAECFIVQHMFVFLSCW